MQQAERPSQAKETDKTAELDNRSILQMQQDVMQEQDQSLVAMEQSVASTRVRFASFNPCMFDRYRFISMQCSNCTHTNCHHLVT